MTPSGKFPQFIQVGMVPKPKMDHRTGTRTNRDTRRATAEKEDATETTATNKTSNIMNDEICKTIEGD